LQGSTKYERKVTKMIELPEGFVLAKQLGETLRGKKIVHAAANASPHKFAWYAGDPAGYDARLSGKTVEDAYAYGGKVHIRLDGGGGLMFCEGVTLRYYPADSAPPQKHQLLIEFDDGSFLAGSVQMYGGLYAYEGELDNEYDALARAKPSVLSDEFDLAYFRSLVPADKRKLPAKALLATEQRIPGLGNGAAQDILFYAGVSPKRDVKTLTEAEWETLFCAVKKTLAEMADKGGRDTEKDLYGNPGGYRTVMSKNSYQSPCPGCGGRILKEAYMGGSVYYCPSCQK
jgi:formamidopyrimidine-DNA glycosylase